MSLFNPWVLLGIILFVTSSFLGGYYKGSEDEVLKQQAEIAKLNEKSRQKEQELASAVNAQANLLMKANQNAKLLQQKRINDINSGAYRLRVAVKAPVCPVPTSSDTAATSGTDAEPPTAELDPAFGKALFALTDEGDDAIRKLSTCVNLYNEALQTLKGK